MEMKIEMNSIKIKAAINDALINALEEIGGEIESQAARNTPVDNGQLAGDWKHNVEANKDSASLTVGHPSEQAIWNEFGTGQYALNGDGRKTPWYVPVEGYTGKKKPSYKGEVVIVYGKGGKAFYKTDGKAPQRSLQKAFENAEELAKNRLKNEFKGM